MGILNGSEIQVRCLPSAIDSTESPPANGRGEMSVGTLRIEKRRIVIHTHNARKDTYIYAQTSYSNLRSKIGKT
jgi:hypothetical protein